MKDHDVSERRACSVAGLDRSTFQYEKKTGGDEALRERLRALAGERRRFGYRRLGILLAREDHHANHKKLYRIYREESCTQTQRPQTRAWDPQTDDDAISAERALELRFRIRQPDRWSPLPHPVCG